jgi:transcriptional regulator with XRE-family HTH domain
MVETRDHVMGVVVLPMSPDGASWSRRQGSDGSLSVGKSGVGGFDGDLLRAVRERVGLTQRDLAERLLRATRADWPSENISRAAQDLDNVRLQVTDYEAGQVIPRTEMVYQLARALGVDVFELLSPDTPYTLEILRARRGLRQADVVDQGLGVGRAYYSRAERGAARLSDEHTRRLADILDVTPTDLAVAITGDRTVGSMSSGRGRAGQRRTRSSS